MTFKANFTPLSEQKKNTRHIIQNMSDLFQNTRHIFFLPRKADEHRLLKEAGKSERISALVEYIFIQELP